MSKRPTAVLMVGRRNAARRAARAAQLTFETIAADEPLPDVTGLRARLAPAAVVATTEAAVLPAARLRAALDLPGNTPATAARCTDKLLMKRAVHAAGLRCARFVAVDGTLDRDRLIAQLGLPLVLKARVGSGGRGARIAHAPEQLPAAVSTPHLAESFVSGIEMSIESFVVDGEPLFVNATEYVEPKWANLAPARLAADTQAALLDLNRRAVQALGVTRGMTHMEVFLTADGPVFGELGARPPGGHLMRLIELAWGFDPWRAVLDVECGRTPQLPATPRQFAGVRFIHPLPGVVRAVHGLDTLQAIAALNEFHCTLEPGKSISPRDGTGQHHGYAILAGSEHEVREGLNAVRDTLRVELESTQLQAPHLR